MNKSIIASSVLVFATACGTSPDASSLTGIPAAVDARANLHCHSRFAFTTRSSGVDIVGFKTGSHDKVAEAIVKIRVLGKITTTKYAVKSSQTKRYSVFYNSADGNFQLRGLDHGLKTFEADLVLNRQTMQMTCKTPN